MRAIVSICTLYERDAASLGPQSDNRIATFPQGTPKCRRLVFLLISGRRALRLAAQATVFRLPCSGYRVQATVFRRSWYLPVYDKPVVRPLRLSKGDCASHGETFHFQRGKPRGRIYICEATELSQIPDHALTSSSQAIAWSILQTPSAR